jgi:hypothetical protein
VTRLTAPIRAKAIPAGIAFLLSGREDAPAVRARSRVTVSRHFPVQDPKSIEAPPIRKSRPDADGPKDDYRIRFWEYLRDLVALALVAGALAGMVYLFHRFRVGP